jgi:hypothetical protein
MTPNDVVYIIEYGEFVKKSNEELRGLLKCWRGFREKEKARAVDLAKNRTGAQAT